MPKSLIGKLVNRAPIPHATPWNRQTGLYGTGTQDRFSQLSASAWQGTLFAIVQLLSTGQAKAKWSLYKTQQDGRIRYSKSDVGSDMRQEILQHQAMKLWQRPNPFMSGYMLRETVWQFMELVGEGYFVLNRGAKGKSVPIEIWPVRPDRIEPVPDRDKYLKGWLYTGPNGEQVPLSVDEVIQMRYPHPTDAYRGLSPVQSLMADIDSNRYTAEWSRNFFLNSATPGGIVTFSKRLNDEEFDEFTERWRESHQGIARGHRVGVLEQGATWTPNTYTVKDMQFVELRTLTRDVIREGYRIHQAMLGDSTDVNRANAQTAEEVHVAWHEIPRLERTRDMLNSFYLPMFGATAPGREFDFHDPTPSSANEANDELTAKSKAAEVLVTAGYDPQDVLIVVGLPPMEFVGPPMQPGAFGQPGQARPSTAASPRGQGHPELNVAAEFGNLARQALREVDFRQDPEAESVAKVLLAGLNGYGNGKAKE